MSTHTACPLTEHEIQSNLKAYEHAMRTGNANEIEVFIDYPENVGRGWKLINPSDDTKYSVYSFYVDSRYRIQPKPTLRPWTIKEFMDGPINFWFRRKGKSDASRITSFDPETGEVWVPACRMSLKYMSEHYECAHLITFTEWHPCGVEEHAK